MRSESSWSRRSRTPLLALCAAFVVPVIGLSLPGCEDKLEPRAYLGPTDTPAYTAPPVFTPGVPTARPAPTDDLVEPPPGVIETCSGGNAFVLGASDTVSLGLSDRITVVSLGTAITAKLATASASCPSSGAAEAVSFDGIGSARAVDARGPAVLAGAAGVSVLTSSGVRLVCDLANVKAVARTPEADAGYAITGTRDLYALDWSGDACVVTPIALAPGVPAVLGTLALGTSASSGPWIATAEREVSKGPGGAIIARARRFDPSTGAVDELSPALGGQAGTVCGIDALAVTDDGERVAIIDGTCGRVSVFRASDGELLAGVSTRARSLAPVPGERAFVTVTRVAGKASFARLDAP